MNALGLVIGHRIRSKRAELGMSQSDLAKGICSQAGISMFENGTDLPMPETLEMLSQRLQDNVLRNYADKIRHGYQVDVTNDEDLGLLLDAFKNQTGRITSGQLAIAMKMVEMLYSKKMIDEVISLTKRIISQYHRTETEPDSVYLKACFFLGSCFLHKFQFDQAIDWLKTSYRGGEHLDMMFLARVCYNLAYAYNGSNGYGQALWYAQNAENIFKDLHDYVNQGKTLSLLGVIQGHLGMHEESVDVLKTGIALMEKWDGSKTDIVRTYCCLADQYLALRETQLATEYCNYVLQLPDILDSDFVLKSSVYRILAMTKQLDRDSDAAMEEFPLALETAQRPNDEWTVARTVLLGWFVLTDPIEKDNMLQIITGTRSSVATSKERGIAFELLAREAMKQRMQTKAARYLGLACECYRIDIASHSDMAIYFEKL